MRSDLIEYARSFSKKIRAVERLGDQEFAMQAELLADLLRAHTALGYTGDAHRGVIQEVHRIMGERFANRERIRDFHTTLAGLATKLGLDLKAIGDSGKGDEDSVMPPLAPAGIRSLDAVREAA